MKIIRLQSSNIMRLVAVDITPKGDLVIVGGRNGAGKSSVLDSIAMALGGMALAPEEPIRAGESEGKVVVDLGELRVTRRFSRECIVDSDNEPTSQWGETRSTLTVTNADGTAQYKSPQAMLDKLLGKLTFDPLAFKDDKDQAGTLRKLVGIDTTMLDQQRQVAFAERASLKKQHQLQEARTTALVRHPDAPGAEVPMQAISDEMQQAEEYRKKAEDAERVVSRIKYVLVERRQEVERTNAKIEELEGRLAELRYTNEQNKAAVIEAEQAFDANQITAQAARAVVPDAAVIRMKLTEAEAVNVKVRDNAKWRAAQDEVARLAAQVAEKNQAVEIIDTHKHQMLAEAKFPIEGLGLDEKHGVTFNGLPFSQASSAEQLRVSVAIGLALNPTLRVLLIRSGNLLDDDSLAAVAAQAAEADAQCWVEWVTKDPEGVSVMIEDGRVV